MRRGFRFRIQMQGLVGMMVMADFLAVDDGMSDLFGLLVDLKRHRP
ncbi:MAG: hypothetical protein AB7E12_05780 [Burkholderiaceae bacterium]